MGQRDEGRNEPQRHVASSTHRRKEREQEDQNYVPVIIKRTDESRRHPDDTMERAVTEGREQLQRSNVSLALSSIAAGLILGFTAMSVGVASSMALQMDPVFERVITALVYPLGFIMCVLSGMQLFTEHTATAVYPVLDRQESFAQLLRLWLVVILGNLFGAALSGWLLSLAEPVVHARLGYIATGRHLVGFDTVPLLVSAVLAGWLMAQGAWLMLSTSHTSGQILAIYIVTFLIGVGGLHHSIAGAVEMFTALHMSDEFTLGQAARFLSLALVGNLIGGSMFVAVLNYAHIRGTQNSD